MKPPKVEDFHNLVGLQLAEAEDLSRKAGWTLRVTRADGRPTVGTCDLRQDRVNVSIVSGRVSAVTSIG